MIRAMSRLPLLALLCCALLATVAARAGAPVPCDGTESWVCEGGRMVKHCCPKTAKCNYRNPPHIDCGDGTCVEGGDEGRCVPPQAARMAAKSEAECTKEYGRWEPACVAHKVTKACVAPVPTNYTGPPTNPPYRTCRDDRCTTSRFIEDCHPARAAAKTCADGWTKVCLEGKVTERCLPAVPDPKSEYRAASYVVCGDGSCAVGADKSVCPP
jgi:hypothetical protein